MVYMAKPPCENGMQAFLDDVGRDIPLRVFCPGDKDSIHRRSKKVKTEKFLEGQ